MNEQHWQVAEAIARALQQQKTDVNELKKLVSYLRWWQNRQLEDGVHHLGSHLVEYLDNLVISGETRSQQTQGYYQTLKKVCQDNLEMFATDTAIEILGWAARLAVYYKLDPQPNEPICEDENITNRGMKTSKPAAFERAKRPQ
jgi:hypothetical protein